MSNMFFKAESQPMKVSLPVELYGEILNQCEKSLPLETGGILVGQYSDDLDCARITRIVDSASKSRRGPFSFFRSNVGLIDILNDEWTKGNYYLGEWHFHPNSSSSPSAVDINQMHKISEHKKLHCPEPILLIIGGCKAEWNISVHVIKGQLIPLLPVGDACL